MGMAQQGMQPDPRAALPTHHTALDHSLASCYPALGPLLAHALPHGLPCPSSHSLTPTAGCSQEAAERLASTLAAAWGEASPGDLAQAPSELAADTLGHLLGCLQLLGARLSPAAWTGLCSRFCPRLAQHLPVAQPTVPPAAPVRAALERLNLRYLRFSLQAARAHIQHQVCACLGSEFWVRLTLHPPRRRLMWSRPSCSVWSALIASACPLWRMLRASCCTLSAPATQWSQGSHAQYAAR